MSAAPIAHDIVKAYYDKKQGTFQQLLSTELLPGSTPGNSAVNGATSTVAPPPSGVTAWQQLVNKANAAAAAAARSAAQTSQQAPGSAPTVSSTPAPTPAPARKPAPPQPIEQTPSALSSPEGRPETP